MRCVDVGAFYSLLSIHDLYSDIAKTWFVLTFYSLLSILYWVLVLGLAKLLAFYSLLSIHIRVSRSIHIHVKAFYSLLSILLYNDEPISPEELELSILFWVFQFYTKNLRSPVSGSFYSLLSIHCGDIEYGEFGVFAFLFSFEYS